MWLAFRSWKQFASSKYCHSTVRFVTMDQSRPFQKWWSRFPACSGHWYMATAYRRCPGLARTASALC